MENLIMKLYLLKFLNAKVILLCLQKMKNLQCKV